MGYTIESVSELEKRITLNISVKDVNGSLDKEISEKRKNLELDGFRKGAVPQSIIEAKFGKELAVRATENLVRSHIDDILKKENIIPAGRLQFEAGAMSTVSRNNPFEISCTVEFMPPIHLPNLEDLTIEVEEVIPTREDIQRATQLFTRRFASLEDKGLSATPVNEDIVLVDIFCNFCGKYFLGGNATEKYLQIGGGQTFKEIEEAICTLTAGQEKSGQFICPQDYIDPEVRSQTVHFQVKLHKVFKEKFPDLDEKLAHAMGQKNVQALRKYIYDYEFNHELKEQKEKSQQKLLQHTLETLDFPLPKSMLERAVRAYLAKTRAYLETFQIEEGETARILKAVQEEAEAYARAQVKAQCFLLALGRRENIVVYEKDAERVIRKMAEEQGQEYQTLREQLWRSGAVHDIQEQLLARKSLEYMYQKAHKIVVDAQGKPVAMPAMPSLPVDDDDD